MEHFIVDMQTEKSKKYYFIREEVSQEIVLLPSQYLMHKMRAKGSPNTIKRSALVISYYLNYLSENQLTMEDEIRNATGTFYRFSYMVKGWDA